MEATETPVPTGPSKYAIELIPRVLKGARLLDKIRPDWAAEIRISKLRMKLCERCILGQLYGHFIRGCREIGLDPFDGNLPPQYGFILPHEWDHRPWKTLSEPWISEIADRTKGEA